MLLLTEKFSETPLSTVMALKAMERLVYGSFYKACLTPAQRKTADAMRCFLMTPSPPGNMLYVKSLLKTAASFQFA